MGRVLQYKDQIDEGNEEVFLGKSYDDDIDSDNSILSKVFEFKTIRKDLRRENKDLVIQYMKILCQLAKNCFIVAYTYLPR